MTEDARKLFQEGRRAEALEAARSALARRPDDPAAMLLAASIAASLGQMDEAAPLLERALAGRPPSAKAEHWRLLAAVRAARGLRSAAVEALREAVRLEPASPVYRELLTAALSETGQWDDALAAAVDLLDVDDSLIARRYFIRALRAGGRVTEAARPYLKRALLEPWTQAEALHGRVLALAQAAGRPPETDDLLAAVLESGPLRDAAAERWLTELRREALFGKAVPHELLASLAIQCFINEYAWRVSDPEAAALEQLRREVAQAPTADGLLRLACYEPLAEAPAGAWPPSVERVLDVQVREPARVRARAAGIEALTPVREGVSAAVREQYEEHPYPRWTGLPRQEPLPIERVLRALFPAARIDPIPSADAPDILVAGCGTGKHAIFTAQRFAGARVLAVDLSRASLAYAQHKSEAMGVGNVTYAQADILELGRLGRAFDVVESVGVLHHMADPGEGLRVLASMVKPGGLMYLGFYSAQARRALQPGKRLAQTFPRTSDGVRRLRQAILDAPPEDPLRAIPAFGDFFAASPCRDLLMHVQEHELTIPELAGLLDANGLRFLGFMIGPDVLADYRRENPQDPAAVDLSRWAAFEARRPDTFRNMYQLWAQKAG